MNSTQFKIFTEFKNSFKSKVQEWNSCQDILIKLQKAAAQKHNTPEYPFETAVVYNRALDEITKDSNIKLIIIGDNPGKDEQLAKNNKYLVGQAGKIAESYFYNHPELDINFRKNAIILNKTPIHSAKTSHLKDIIKNGSSEIKKLIEETQIWMAKETAKLLINLNDAANSCNSKSSEKAQIWLIGYSELKPKGIFETYRNELKKSLKTSPDWNNTLVFQHFSMNRFSINLCEYCNNLAESKNISLWENIQNLGKIHRDEIFC